MAINKVVYGNDTLIDLTNDTATEDDVLEGVTFHDKSGSLRSGSLKPVLDVEVDGNSIVDQDGVANITSDNLSVIAKDLTENKTANVTDGVADFETIDGSLVKSLIVEIEPSQSGSGTPSPSNIRPISGYTQEDLTVVGKNRLPLVFADIKSLNTSGTWSGNVYTFNGITFTIHTDNSENITSISISGTATTGVSLLIKDFTEYLFSENSYILNDSVNASAISKGSCYVSVERKKGASGNVNYPANTNNASRRGAFTVDYSQYDRYRVLIYMPVNTVVNNAVFYPMVRLSTESDSTFEPYHGKTYTTPFNQTIYGGTLDVLTGELTIDKWYVQITAQNVTFNSTNNRGLIRTNLVSIPYAISSPNTVNCICDKFESISQTEGVVTGNVGVYAHGQIIAICGYKTSLEDYQSWLTDNPVTIVYEIDTPQTIQLTPQKVKSLVGENHIMASTGDVLECKYSMLINGDDLEMLLSSIS